jgi:hypothetical protein
MDGINVGNGAMHMRSWYLCERGGCLSSKSWTTVFPDLQDNQYRKGQRYYCFFCNRRYRPNMGQLVETKLKSGIYWALAAMPPKEIEDLRAMAVEQDFKDKAIEMPTPLELYNSIKQYVPITWQGILRPAQHSDIWYPQNSKDASTVVTMCSMLTPQGRAVFADSTSLSIGCRSSTLSRKPCTVPTTEPNRMMFNQNKQFLLPWNDVVTGLPEDTVFLASNAA